MLHVCMRRRRLACRGGRYRCRFAQRTFSPRHCVRSCRPSVVVVKPPHALCHVTRAGTLFLVKRALVSCVVSGGGGTRCALRTYLLYRTYCPHAALEAARLSPCLPCHRYATTHTGCERNGRGCASRCEVDRWRLVDVSNVVYVASPPCPRWAVESTSSPPLPLLRGIPHAGCERNGWGKCPSEGLFPPWRDRQALWLGSIAGVWWGPLPVSCDACQRVCAPAVRARAFTRPPWVACCVE